MCEAAGLGTRETDLLQPVNMVSHVDAICLTGGSAYGLDAAGGVMAWLESQRRGFQIGTEPGDVVPIVPTAVIFDLRAGGDFSRRPDAEFGRRAAAAARTRLVRQGTVGAGTGAHAAALKGGVGSASVVLDSGVTVAALVVLNSGGSPVDPATGELWGARYGIGDEFARLRRPTRADLRGFLAIPWPPVASSTTLAVVATDAELTKAECSRVAVAGHDGMARAISPIHTYTDGDVVFTLATGERARAAGAVGRLHPSGAGSVHRVGADHRRGRRRRHPGRRPRHPRCHVRRGDEELRRSAPVGGPRTGLEATTDRVQLVP